MHQAACNEDSESEQFKRVCYFTNWSCDLLVAEAHFYLHHLKPHLCSHLIYAFVNINVTSLELTPSRVDDESTISSVGRFVLVNLLKRNNTGLKTLLSIGGSHQPEEFIQVTSSAASRKQFVTNAAAYVRKWGFDGIDVDWEYPHASHREALTALVQDFREAFREEANQTGNPELLLSLAAPASEALVNTTYEVKEISRNVDMINLMAYDYSGAWNDRTSFNSPLFARNNDPRFSYKLCVALQRNHDSESLKENPDLLGLIARDQSDPKMEGIAENMKAPRPKNFLGHAQVPRVAEDVLSDADNDKPSLKSGGATQTESGPEPSPTPAAAVDCLHEVALHHQNGRTLDDFHLAPIDGAWETDDETSDLEAVIARYPVGSKVKEAGRPGRLRRLNGQLSYAEICEYMSAGGIKSFDDVQRVPYLVYGDQWVGFEDEQSVEEKVRYAVSKNLGGVMMWSLDLDDFKGDYCNKGPHPLLTSISDTVASLFNVTFPEPIEDGYLELDAELSLAESADLEGDKILDPSVFSKANVKSVGLSHLRDEMPSEVTSLRTTLEKPSQFENIVEKLRGTETENSARSLSSHRGDSIAQKPITIKEEILTPDSSTGTDYNFRIDYKNSVFDDKDDVDTDPMQNIIETSVLENLVESDTYNDYYYYIAFRRDFTTSGGGPSEDRTEGNKIDRQMEERMRATTAENVLRPDPNLYQDIFFPGNGCTLLSFNRMFLVLSVIVLMIYL
ncbi:probable chitinase 10 [Aplysia californica]|uniref:Probable chitinase 10 n=1 Tax=Aplysia californica TaxID=6500 RepID=A0ABM1VUB6_APLCA|nr:probable chitinase 10 [Aplysia californica]